jgi:hypothetical protein
VHDNFRKFEEEQREMERLRQANREYRGSLLRLNMEYQAMRERNEELQRRVTAADGGVTDGRDRDNEARERKFDTTIRVVAGIIQEVL